MLLGVKIFIVVMTLSLKTAKPVIPYCDDADYLVVDSVEDGLELINDKRMQKQECSSSYEIDPKIYSFDLDTAEVKLESLSKLKPVNPVKLKP